jgi:hypothetical protein
MAALLRFADRLAGPVAEQRRILGRGKRRHVARVIADGGGRVPRLDLADVAPDRRLLPNSSAAYTYPAAALKTETSRTRSPSRPSWH